MATYPKVIGNNSFVTLKRGQRTRVILLNNAATTPPFKETLKAVNSFLKTYGAFHRGTGPHANITFQQTKKAIETIGRFLNIGKSHSLLFTQNTSAAINLFIRLLHLKSDDVIITSTIEHTSNNLPWMLNTKARVIYVNAFSDGALDYEDLEKKVTKYSKNLKLIAITGASNLTGYIPNIKRVSKLAHENGAMIFVDAAQLAPHREIDMVSDDIDALAFSAHKMYAPFGIGVLALPKELLNTDPVDPGGGSIDMISDQEIVWAPSESRHQTGTWNVTGIIATAASCKTIMDFGWDKVTKHEQELVKYSAKKLSVIKGLTLYVPKEKYLHEDRIGTFTFNLKGYHHALLSAILENEYGIETRAGTICNHKLVRSWFNIDDKKQREIEEKIRKGDRLASYGIVRVSLGIHNRKKDVEALCKVIKSISLHGAQFNYKKVPKEEIYILAG